MGVLAWLAPVGLDTRFHVRSRMMDDLLLRAPGRCPLPTLCFGQSTLGELGPRWEKEEKFGSDVVTVRWETVFLSSSFSGPR